MNPYPWKEYRNLTWQRAWSRRAKLAGRFLTVLGVLCSPLSLIVRVWAHVGFAYYNDSWVKRGLITVIIGAVGTLLVTGINPSSLVGLWTDVAYSLGVWAQEAPSTAITRWLLLGTPVGMVFVGLASLGSSAHYEFASQRYLQPIKPTVRLRRRMRRNTQQMQESRTPEPGNIAFGLVADDPVPWRTGRYGDVVERSMERLGHGVVLGANDTGKTKEAENIASQFTENGGAVFYPDFKGSDETRTVLRGIAQTMGVPFYSFTLGGMPDAHQCSYDPLSWDGSPSEKTSMLMEAFNFAEGGAAEFYRNAAEAWLPLQFEVLDAVGLASGEGTFDFLLRTCYPNDLMSRAQQLKAGSPHQQERAQRFQERIQGVEAKNLTGLRNNLERVVNSAGPYLRPQSGHYPALNLRKAAQDGAVVYIGLSATADATTMRTIGSLVVRDVTAMIGERLRSNISALRPLLLMPDEASRLGARAVTLDDAFAQAREALVWIWPITQTFGTWPETTRRELMQNAKIVIVFRVNDEETAAEISGAAGSDAPYTRARQQQKIVRKKMHADEVQSENRGNQWLDVGTRLPADWLLKTPARHAYIIARGDADECVTRTPWVNRRVGRDEVPFDIPMMRVVLRNEVATPPAVPDAKTVTFSHVEQSLGAEQPQQYPNGNEAVTGRNDGVQHADALPAETRNTSAGQQGTSGQEGDDAASWWDDDAVDHPAVNGHGNSTQDVSETPWTPWT